MKGLAKKALKALVFVAFVAISVICGWQLTYLIDLLPFNMPYPVEMFIRFCLSVTGNNHLGNPDDMEVLSLLLYWAMATLLVGALLFICYWAVRRHLIRKARSR